MPIVQATLTASAVRSNPVSAKMIEHAMAEAVKECIAKGITNPDEMRAKMLEARERVKKLPSFQTVGNRVLFSRIATEYAKEEVEAPKPKPFWRRLFGR